MRRDVSPALALASWAWLTILLAAPVKAAGVSLSAAAYVIGSYICHQQSARSFHIGAAQVPVCARCLGLYAGAAVGAAAWLALRRHVGVHVHGIRVVLMAAAVPMLAAWVSEAGGLASVSNTLRAAAALPLGALVAGVVMATADRRLRAEARLR